MLVGLWKRVTDSEPVSFSGSARKLFVPFDELFFLVDQQKIPQLAPYGEPFHPRFFFSFVRILTV